LYINWNVIVGEQAKRGWYRTLPEVIALFETNGAIKNLKTTVERHPYMWQPMWSGLGTSSVLNHDADMEWFFLKLAGVDPGFFDFSYSPGEVLSIDDEPSMHNFRLKFRNKYHTPRKDKS
jgi:hypothetical protein